MVKKACKYGCGTEIEWDNESGKFVEVGTKTWHSYPRCKKILERQGREVPFDSW